MHGAIVPDDPSRLNNRIFRYSSDDSQQDHSDTDFFALYADRAGYSKLRDKFDSNGGDLHTIDKVDVNDIDVCIFIDNNEYYLQKCLSCDDTPLLAYIMREPPSVDPRNSVKNLMKISNLYDIIFTWNDELSSINDRFVPYRYPLPQQRSKSSVPFDDQNLLVNISTRRYSNHPNELYTAREEVISYYQTNHNDQFTLHGRYWDDPPRPQDIFRHRKLFPNRFKTDGPIEKKSTAYHSHRFALCFENMTGINGYITEKIFDCLRMQVVPIYWGANNISEYVPENAFIDYRKFGSPDQLHDHISSINKFEYNEYLDAAEEFLVKKADRFKPSHFADHIYDHLCSVTPQPNKSMSESSQRMIDSNAVAGGLLYNKNQMSLSALTIKTLKLTAQQPKSLIQTPELPYSIIKRVVKKHRSDGKK